MGTVLGPVVGVALAQSTAAWRWAFYINLCIGIPFVPVYIFLLPRCDPQPEVSITQMLLQIDYLGAILKIGMLTCFIMGINFGGVMFDWVDGSFRLLLGGLMLLVLFIMQQLDSCGTTQSERIFPCHLLRHRSMFTLFLLMSAATTCVLVPTYYIPLYFQFVRGVSPLSAALGLLPFIILMVTFGFINGAMMSKLGYCMPWYLAGGILTTVGGALMTAINEVSLNTQIYGYSALIGIGAGCFIQAGFSVAQAIHPSLEADATSFMSPAQNLGITFALAVSGAVFRSPAIDKLQKILPDLSKDELRGAITGTDSGIFTHLDDDTRAKMIHAVVNAKSHTYFVVMAAGGMAVIGSSYLKRMFTKAAGAVKRDWQ